VITTIDSSVVLDILGADPIHGPGSLRALGDAQELGVVLACDVVWAEVGAYFPDPASVADALDGLDIRFAAIDPEVAAAAGRVWLGYRRRGGGRDRMLPDFLIGTHAWMRADRFLTRDRGFYREYFRRARIVDPSAS
jgi:predicted nucleic acid-binding protein